MPRMTIPLVLLPNDRVVGVYRVNGETGRMPERLRQLAPDAAVSFATALADKVVVSDMLRSAESSLQAVREGRGAQRPGYSGHNYGLSIDLAVKESIKRTGFKTKAQLDAFMLTEGWYCHRRDHLHEHESWHFNYLGKGTLISDKVRTTAGYLEAEIKFRFDKYWAAMSPREVQQALVLDNCYHGAVDGILGPRSTEALRMFQRKVDLPDTGKLDEKTRRTLAFVTAEKKVVVEKE